MQINKDSIFNFFLYVSAFFLGLGFHLVYAPIILILALIRFSIGRSVRKEVYVAASLIILFLVPQYLIGYDNIKLSNPILSLLSVLFSVVVFGYVLGGCSSIVARNFLIYFAFGIGLEALIIILHSFFLDSSLYGYGFLYSPLMGSEVKSPGVALRLSIFASVLTFFIFNGAIYTRLFSLCMLVFISFFAVWLASRAYFVLLALSLLLSFLFNMNIKNVIMVMMLIFLGLFFIQTSSNFYMDYIFVGVDRFGLGLESLRFKLWLDGFLKMISHPLGGFEVDKSIDDVDWFHNIFLDAARLAGWFPVFMFLFFIFYSFIVFLNRRNEYYKFGGVLFIVVLALVQQDVVVEAMVKSILVLYFCCLMLLSRNLKPV